MGKLQKNESGFSAVEIVLVIVIVALIGTVGWLIYKNHHKTTTAAVTTTSSTKPATSTKATSTQTTSTTTPTPISTSAVTTLVTNFYNQYTACYANGAGDLNQTCTNNLVSADGTSALYSYYSPPSGYSYPASPIQCAQDTPTSISVSGVTSTSTQASGNVIEDFGSSSSSVTIKFTVVNQSGNLKIDTVTCSPPLVASQGSP